MTTIPYVQCLTELSISSIQAVLAPEQHDYLYFVATPDGSGRHVFATTLEEHTVNVQKYQAGN